MAILGIPVGAIASLVIILVFFNPFTPACIQLQPVPAGSGVPDFPLAGTTDFSQTWCASTVLYHVHVLLTIHVGNETVPLPVSLGINNSYPGGRSCVLPIHTHDASGTIHLESPWPYEYTLRDFFGVWAEAGYNVNVNSSFPNQPVNYTGASLFGLPMGSGHSLTLFVDGRPSSAGPGLDLTRLDNPPGPNPACLGEEFGTGHTVTIDYI